MNAGQSPLNLKSPDEDAAKEQPLDRALAVLEAVAIARRPITMTSIAMECDLPVPTVHRLVTQLEKRGLLKRVPGSKKLLVGCTLVNLSVSVLESALRSDRPHQILVAFANEIGEHCQVATRVDDSLFYLDTARALNSQGLHFEQGRRSPLHCTSIGKLFLAELDAEDLEWWLGHARLDPLTPRTLVSPRNLLAEIDRVRREGWGMNNEELALGVVGCAVPIRDTAGRLTAGLGISAPSARVAFAQLPQFRTAMEATAARIMAALPGGE
jgi:DNA-binding IclR family transcriptional regulator